MFLVTVILFLNVMGENDINSALNSLNSALQAQTSYLNQQNLIQAEKDMSDEEKAWSEKMMDKQNDWSLNMWNKTNEYNSPSAQLQRLLEAGLNPLYFGLDGSSANGLESAQALGYERASMKGFNNPGQLSLENQIALKSLEKDIQLKNAQIDSIKENTKGTSLDNEWKDKTMDARVRSEELANELSVEQKKKIGQEIQNMKQELKKRIAETESEQERKVLIQAEAALARAQENEIISLLPYRQLLIEAQAESEKADAAMKWTQAAYQQGLIDSGYIDWLAEDMHHQAQISGNRVGQSESEAAIAEWKAAIKNGTAISYEGKSIFGKGVAVLGNTFLRTTSQLSESLGGSLVPLVGAGLIGKGLSNRGNAAASAGNPSRHGSYTTLYGPDGNTISRNSW